MWWSALDGLVIGAIVALAVRRPWQRESLGASVTLVVGLVGGLVGAWLGFTIGAGSLATGPLQPAAIIGGLLGAVVTLVVLRSWKVNDRNAVLATAAAVRVSEARAAKASRRTARSARPVPLAGLAVAVLTVLRGRGGVDR